MYYLGVDGGGTKTAFIIIDEKGNIIASHQTTGSYYMQIGFDGFYEVINEGLNKILNKANLSISDINYSFLGLPGFGEILEDMPHIKEIIRKLFPENKYSCGNDVEVSWAGTLACQPGINLVAGTGAIGFGRDQKGNVARASGWGEFCGDEGSAYWIGKETIMLFTKEADGRLEKTPIYHIIKENYSLKRDLDLLALVRDRLEMKRDAIAQFSRLLYQAAESDDKRAQDIFKKAAYENSLTVKALVNKLDFDSDKTIKISYSGGVFKAGKHILEPLINYLNDYQVKLVKPILEPVLGAALYALKIDGKANNLKKVIENLVENQENHDFE